MDSRLTQHQLAAICASGGPFSEDEMSRLVFDLMSTQAGQAYDVAEQRFFALIEIQEQTWFVNELKRLICCDNIRIHGDFAWID